MRALATPPAGRALTETNTYKMITPYIIHMKDGKHATYIDDDMGIMSVAAFTEADIVALCAVRTPSVKPKYGARKAQKLSRSLRGLSLSHIHCVLRRQLCSER